MQKMREDLNQLYLPVASAIGGFWIWGQVEVLLPVMEFAKITADRFALAGVASGGWLGLRWEARAAIDFGLEEELKRTLLI